jgi:lipopolysaccharide transport system permease protein
MRPSSGATGVRESSIGIARVRDLPGVRRRAVHLRDITMHLVGRSLATRYRGSLLGWLWSLTPPLLLLLATYFLFTHVIALDVPNYPVFLLTGILAWNWLSRGLPAATSSLEDGRSLALRPAFPSVLLPIVAVLVALVDYVLALPILLVAVGLTVGLQPTALLLPVLIAIQFVFAIGLGLMLAPLQVFFRDVAYLVGVLLTLGFWITPIVYAVRQVPDRFGLIYDLNPMAHLIEAQRRVLIDGALPSARPLVLTGVAALAILTAGFAVFASTRRAIPDHL